MEHTALENYVRETRRALHRIPELAFDLPKTSAYIYQELISFGYSPIATAKTGWIAVLPGMTEEAVAFRADMDALPVTEDTGVDFASEHPGKMHACGHDGHMAMLLGFAKKLKEMPTPEKTVVLIFQPAEEAPGGARLIMESGILKTLRVKQIFGFHLYPGLPEGVLGLTKGPMMARNGEFDITIKGKSSHAGQPHEGADALLAGASLVASIQTIGSRNLNPLSPFVVNVGTFNAGEARNIVAGLAELMGTIRSFDKESYEKIKEKLHHLAKGAELSYGVTVELEIRDYYPEVNNDESLVEKIMTILPESSYQVLKPVMLAEDFSFYQQEIPGVFMFLGTRKQVEPYYSLHSARFNFDEQVLQSGIEYYSKILSVL